MKLVITILLLTVLSFANIYENSKFSANELLITFKDNITMNEVNEILVNKNMEIIRSYKILPNTFYVRKINSNKSLQKATDNEKLEVTNLITHFQTVLEVENVEHGF